MLSSIKGSEEVPRFVVEMEETFVKTNYATSVL
jgi:hypothetical protein